MKTHYALGLIFLFVLIIFLGVYPFSKEIDKEIPAILSTADENAQTYTNKSTVIHVKGKTYRKVFRKPEFDVAVTVDGFNWMTDGSHSNSTILTSDRKGNINMGVLQHDYSPKYSGTDWFDYTKTAVVWFDDDFEQVHISTSTREWKGEPEKESRALLITGSAKNEDEAREIQRKFSEKYSN